MRQRDVGPNNHEEEQEGTNVERKDREGLEGSNALRRRVTNTSRPSIADTAPLHMVAEMQMMKEMMDFMMNVLGDGCRTTSTNWSIR